MWSEKSSDRLEHEKQTVASAALRWVRSGMTMGLGTGTTARYFIAFLGERVRGGELAINAVPSSSETAAAARREGIPLVDPRRGMRLDLTVDGADEIAPDLTLIKGGGGALLREKVLARVSRYYLVIGDSSKPVGHLGRFPLPVEVVPFALPWVMDQIEALGGQPVLRPARDSAQPFLTDQRNYIVDCHFGSIAQPTELAASLRAIPGIVEHGLFLGLGQAALISNGPDVTVLRRDGPPTPLADFNAVV